MSTSAAAFWMAQMCAAIGAMHAAGVVHRDVKPDNFMLSNGVLKLADFGLSAVLPREGMLSQKCGTPAFMAPEQHDLVNSGGYGMAVDMWAAGVILYMMLNGGRHPFLKGQRMDMEALAQGKLPKASGSKLACLVPGKSGSAFSDELLKALIFVDPRRRFNARDALNHPFLVSEARKRAGAAARP